MALDAHFLRLVCFLLHHPVQKLDDNIPRSNFVIGKVIYYQFFTIHCPVSLRCLIQNGYRDASILQLYLHTTEWMSKHGRHHIRDEQGESAPRCDFRESVSPGRREERTDDRNEHGGTINR